MDRIVGILGGVVLTGIVLVALWTLAPQLVESIWPTVLSLVQFLIIVVLGGGLLAFAAWKFSDK